MLLYFCNYAVCLLLKLVHLGVMLQNISRAFYPFGNVAVPKVMGLNRALNSGIITKVKGRYSSRFKEAVVHRVNRDFPI